MSEHDITDMHTKILEANIPEESKAKYFIKLCNINVELYTPITNMLINTKNNNILRLFLDEYDNVPTKRKISFKPGSEWTDEQLDNFSIVFEDVKESSEICELSPISEQANKFIQDNSDIDENFAPESEEQIGERLNTAFKGYLLYVIKSPNIESCVDDMIQHLLQQTLGSQFLVKTRYETNMIMSGHNTKATADVIAIFLPKLYMGIIIVEDKPHNKSKSNKEHKDAEAQVVAEAIAVVQQKRWPKGSPIFMLRVLGTNVTFYKAQFDDEIINAVSKGTHRINPFIIKRLEHINPLYPDDRPGYNILKRDERNIVIKLLNDIGIYITQMFS